jgi:TetR/AcrR family transcriptional regulator, regulator of biofilm formation and stress response
VTDQRAARRRRAILNATLRLIGRRGPEAVTHRAVAAEAGVPLASITYYFGSRDGLLDEALRHVAEEEMAALRAVAQAPPANPTPEALADILVALAQRGVADGGRSLVAEYELWLEAARRPALRPSARAWNEVEVDAAEPWLRALGSPTPREDARVLVAMLDGLGLELLTEDDPPAAARALRSTVLRLVRALTATV